MGALNLQDEKMTDQKDQRLKNTQPKNAGLNHRAGKWRNWKMTNLSMSDFYSA